MIDLAESIRREGAVVVHHAYEQGPRRSDLADRHAALITVGLIRDAESDVEDVIAEVERADGGGFVVKITGEWTTDRDFNQLSQDDLREGELKFGLPVAFIVLLLVFGTIVAGLVPVLMAIISIVVALGLTALLGQAFELSIFTVNMLTGMGLALGIDYSLFVISRFREERAQGREHFAAIDVVSTTAGRAVVFSGLAFVLAMFGMVLVPDTILRSLAAGAILVGIVSVLASMSLLPALLGLIGDRVNALKIPLIGRSAQAGTASEGRMWSAIVRGVMRRPALTATLSVAFLLALSLPVLSLKLGFSGVRETPDRLVAKQGFIALERYFGVGTLDEVEVVVDGDVSSPASAKRHQPRSREAGGGVPTSRRRGEPRAADRGHLGAADRRQPRREDL